MDLSQIIIFSLKLFSGILVILVCISYLIYKIRNRKKAKPYQKRVSVQQKVLTISTPQYNEPIIEQEDTRERFQVLNNQNFVPVQINNNTGRRQVDTRGYINTSTGQFNIYNYYSKSNFEPMHKLKL